MPIPTNAVVRVMYRSRCQAQRILFSMDYLVLDSASTQTVTEDLEEIATWFGDESAGDHLDTYLSAVGTDFTLDEIRTQVLKPTRSAFVTLSKGLPGLYDSTTLTTNLQTPVTFRTADAGRSQVAVKKIGPPPLGTYVSGEPTAPYKVILQDFAERWYERYIVGASLIDLHPIVYHPVTGTGSLIQTWAIGDRIGTMRRRTLRVGE